MRVFEIIGPVMVGPSSSHTAGAVRIGLAAREALGEAVEQAKIELHGSYAAKAEGHHTDLALVAGLLGMDTDDERIKHSFAIAAQQGMKYTFVKTDLGPGTHINSARLTVQGAHRRAQIVASSLGGGRIVVTHRDGKQVPPVSHEAGRDEPCYERVDALVQRAQRENCSIGHVALCDEALAAGESQAQSLARMQAMLEVMRHSVQEGERAESKTQSGMVCAEGHAIKRAMEQKKLPDDLLHVTLQKALSAATANACMGCIVAAPTAGACGILAGVLLAAQQCEGYADAALCEALFAAGALGMVVAQRSTLSGSQGGCQVECGVGGGMAAAALTQLRGGTPQQVADAFAIALKSALGLVCDPVAGLVEVPCVKRNGNYAAVALSSSAMAIAGLSSFIPPDEVIDAMDMVGSHIDPTLRCTDTGGLAGTPTAQRTLHQIFGEKD